MTTATPLFTAPAADARCGLAQDLADAAAWIACDLGAVIPPDMTIQVPVPHGLDHAGKRDWLAMVARSWKTEVRPDGQGGEIAVRQFGHLRFTASVAAHYATAAGYFAAAKARREAAA